MKQVESAVFRYARMHFPGDGTWYQWPLSREAARAEFGIHLTGETPFSATRDLKRQLSALWHGGQVERERIATWFVKKWGGIRRISEPRLAGYVAGAPDKLIGHGVTGIASWSKVLCLEDPSAYAIYDARVAVALNALQLRHRCSNLRLFPLLPSRNKVIAAANRLLSDSGARRVAPVPPHKAYRSYLALLRSVSQKCNVPLDAVEMLLFAKGPELACEVFPQLSAVKAASKVPKKNRSTEGRPV